MKLYWTDLETTGLDAITDDILEVAIAEADFDRPFEILRRFTTTLKYTKDMRMVHPFVREMHQKNGLWEACASSGMSPANAEQILMDFVGHGQKSDENVLAGSSIHFDHTFLLHSMPYFGKRFSHRHYDVSAVKLFCQSLGMPKLPKAEAHRAMDDINESIQHAQACNTWLRERR